MPNSMPLTLKKSQLHGIAAYIELPEL